MNKILLFIKTPPPITGATLMNNRVFKSKLLQESFSVHSICISYMLSLDEMGKLRLSKFLKFISVIIKLFRELITFKPKLVYFQISPHGIAFIRDFSYILIIKSFRVKIVFHMRGKGINNKSIISKYLFKFAFKNQEIICLSQLLTSDLGSVYRKKIHIVPNGIPIANNINQTKIIQTETVKVLFLSNLIKSKGLLDYLDALEIINKHNYEFEGIIVGSESDISRNQLSEYVNSKGLSDRVKYLGAKYENEKYDILNNVDILVFPTTNDIWGNVNLEAMQCSVPVIATNEGAIPEIIDNGITGFIVDKKSPKQIAEKIEYLINNPEKRTEMGKAGRKKFLEKYTLDKFEENMKNVFDEILARIHDK